MKLDTVDPSQLDAADIGVATMGHSIDSIHADLRAHEIPCGITDRAWDEIFERASEFLSELGLEATRRARQKRAEVVSRSDVSAADQALRHARQTSLTAASQTLGGVLCGGGVSGVIAYASDTHPSVWALVVSVAGLVSGAAIIAFAIGRAWGR